VNASERAAGVVKALLLASNVDVGQLKSSFSVRLESQKKIFLLQLHPELTDKLGFRYNLYVRGPYSPDLARIYYDLEAVQPAQFRFSEDALAYIKEIASLKNPELVLLSTVFSVLEYANDVNQDTIVDTVRNLKPEYSSDEVKHALAKARELRKRFDLPV